MNPQQQQLRNSKPGSKLFVPVLLLVAGFIAGVVSSATLLPKLPFMAGNTVSKSAGSSLFTMQNATIEGKITKVSGRVVSVENTKGVKGDLDLSKNVMIGKNTNQGVATPSSDLKNIELNKTAFISLNSNPESGKLEVNMITYMNTSGTGAVIAPPPLPKGSPPPPPAKPQAASGSAVKP